MVQDKRPRSARACWPHADGCARMRMSRQAAHACMRLLWMPAHVHWLSWAAATPPFARHGVAGAIGNKANNAAPLHQTVCTAACPPAAHPHSPPPNTRSNRYELAHSAHTNSIQLTALRRPRQPPATCLLLRGPAGWRLPPRRRPRRPSALTARSGGPWQLRLTLRPPLGSELLGKGLGRWRGLVQPERVWGANHLTDLATCERSLLQAPLARPTAARRAPYARCRCPYGWALRTSSLGPRSSLTWLCSADTQVCSVQREGAKLGG